MRHFPLGATGTLIPDIMIGTMTWGTQTSQAEAHRQIATCLERGFTWFDTAEMYPVNPVRAETVGLTETIIGAYIARHGKGEMRIATKIVGEGTAVARGGAAISPKTLVEAVEGSLTRLNTDHIELYQLHWPNRGSYHFRKNWTYQPPRNRTEVLADLEACLQALETLKAEGKIGAFGLSNETAWGMAQWLRLAEEGQGPRPVSIQNEYSMMARLYDTDMAELSAMEDVTLLAFSPLATGLLTGKYLQGAIPEGSRRGLSPELGGRWQPRVDGAVEAYVDLADRAGLSPVHLALGFCFARPFPCVPIFGATTQAQLEHGLDATGLTLPDDVLAEIDAIHRAHPMPY